MMELTKEQIDYKKAVEYFNSQMEIYKVWLEVDNSETFTGVLASDVEEDDVKDEYDDL